MPSPAPGNGLSIFNRFLVALDRLFAPLNPSIAVPAPQNPQTMPNAGATPATTTSAQLAQLAGSSSPLNAPLDAAGKAVGATQGDWLDAAQASTPRVFANSPEYAAPGIQALPGAPSTALRQSAISGTISFDGSYSTEAEDASADLEGIDNTPSTAHGPAASNLTSDPSVGPAVFSNPQYLSPQIVNGGLVSGVLNTGPGAVPGSLYPQPVTPPPPPAPTAVLTPYPDPAMSGIGLRTPALELGESYEGIGAVPSLTPQAVSPAPSSPMSPIGPLGAPIWIPPPPVVPGEDVTTQPATLQTTPELVAPAIGAGSMAGLSSVGLPIARAPAFGPAPVAS